MPEVELGSDWIIGCPGETDADFEQTLVFVEEVGFVANSFFKYAPRLTTHAAEELPDDVPTAVKKERNHRLLVKAEEIATLRLGRYVGQSVQVFVEDLSGKNPASLHGRSIHGIPVCFAGDGSLIGTSIRVAIPQASAHGMHGVVAVVSVSLRRRRSRAPWGRRCPSTQESERRKLACLLDLRGYWVILWRLPGGTGQH